MLIILGVLVLAIILIVWLGVLKPKEEIPVDTSSQQIPMSKTVKINWPLLQDAKLEELKDFEKILPFEDEIGRKNPFIPY